ncbi:ATP-binding protein [Cupriavidus sp. 2TAF22]
MLRPIRVRLSLVFVLFLLLVVGVGLFGINRLSSFHSVSAQISGRWLQSNRILGDLNNYISDYRAFEGDALIATTRADLRAAQEQIGKLDDVIKEVEGRYGKIAHDPAERALYEQFIAQWSAYRQRVDEVVSLAHQKDTTQAVALYRGESRRAFERANGTLGVLTERNVAGAADATAREADAYQEARRLIAGAILVSCCLVIAAVAYLVMAVSNPIAALVERMHRITDNDPHVDIPGAGRKDEIGEIARAVVRFRDNTLELEGSKAALAAQTTMLQDTLENERRMAMLQRNFVSMASHEFRTPLNVIDGHAQRLMRMKEAPSAEVLAERCGRIRGAVRRMTSLIDHLLDSSQLLDGGRLATLRSVDFSLGLLVHEVCDMHRESSPAASIEEIVDPGVSEVIHGDARLLFQAFSNLIGNAIKYSPAGTPVVVYVRGDADALSVSVSDRGMGIPDKDRDHIFERFVRGGNVAGTAGAGVGLYLVRLVVDLHGGEVRVTSEEGRGSCFQVRLPRAAAQP